VEIESTSVELFRKEPKNFRTIAFSDYRVAPWESWRSQQISKWRL